MPPVQQQWSQYPYQQQQWSQMQTWQQQLPPRQQWGAFTMVQQPSQPSFSSQPQNQLSTLIHLPATAQPPEVNSLARWACLRLFFYNKNRSFRQGMENLCVRKHTKLYFYITYIMHYL
jgi:hypothetical protein